MSDEAKNEDEDQDGVGSQTKARAVYLCDRCGFQMVERNCKVECPNCGNRFDCSDLNIYFD
jgi:rubrerythrin